MKNIKIHYEDASLFTLRFTDKNLEAGFYRYYINTYLWQLRLAHIIAAIFFFVAVFAENFLTGLSTVPSWLRIGIVVPSFIIGLTITYLYTEFYKKNYQYFNIYYVLASGISFIFAGAGAPESYMYSLYSGLIICLLFNYIFIRLSFLYSTLSGTILLILFLYVAFFIAEKADFLIHMTIYTIVIHCFGIFVSYLIEYDSKRSYLLLIQTRKDAEIILEANRNLENKVKERTSELSEAKLKAEESDRLKTEFLNNMSHEIRTPMNGIIGFAQLLDDPEISAEQSKSYVGIIQNSSQQLLRIIDDILEISTLETKQVRSVVHKFKLNDVLMSLFAKFDANAKEKNINLYVKNELRDENSYIFTDKKKLVKVLTNLLENSLKFTFEGYIEFGYHKNGEHIELYVKDTGIGIDLEKFNVIFKSFVQGNIDLSRKYGGLGLGLSIAKENINLLGGNIRLESKKEKGTTFYITLPRVLKKPNSGENIILNEPDPINKNSEIMVLLAEDEEVNSLYIQEILRQSKDPYFKIIHAKNGKDAVEICKNNEIDIVLMDIKMPIMNGYDATKKIKRINPSIPIIALTAFSTEMDRNKAMAAGCDEFISKPVRKFEFFKILTQFIKVKSTRPF